MQNIRAAFIVAAVLPACAVAQIDCGIAPCSSGAPKFSEYPAKRATPSHAAAVNLKSHARAREFRTRLREGAAIGPNFAGAFTVVTWGCGVACQDLAIVDARNGAVHFPPSVKLNAYHYVHEDRLPNPYQFQLNSDLLVLVGSPNDAGEAEAGIFFYRWTGRDLKLVHRELRTWD